MPSSSPEQGALRAPWIPDTQLVYAKDSVEFFSEEFADDAAAASEVSDRSARLLRDCYLMVDGGGGEARSIAGRRHGTHTEL